jgi:hypothetical protein
LRGLSPSPTQRQHVLTQAAGGNRRCLLSTRRYFGGFAEGFVTVSYLADSLAAFLLPDLELQIKPLLIIAPLVGEIWMVVYLLAKGVRSGRQTDLAPATGLV